MPTKSITISCDEVKITPNGIHAVSVEIEGFSVDDLLDTIDQDDITSYVERHLNPEDVFPIHQLEKWAESEGYIKATDND
jgi:hypothetical protein